MLASKTTGPARRAASCHSLVSAKSTNVMFIFLSRLQWMYNWCRLGLLGNSSTASGSSNPVWDGRPELQLGRSNLFFFVPAAMPSIFTLLFLPSSFACLSYFILAVPMRKCSVEYSCESYISYSYTDWSFFHDANGPCCGRSFAYQKLNYNKSVFKKCLQVCSAFVDN